MKLIKFFLYQLKYGTINPTRADIVVRNSYPVFKKFRILFIHIPKAAGVSVYKSIYGIDSFGHARIVDYFRHYPLKEVNKLFKFTVVRNPYERLESAFFYLKKGGRSKDPLDLKYQSILSKYNSFEDFIMNFFRNNLYLEIEHLIPQYLFITDDQGNILVDYVAKIETISKDFGIIESKINVKYELKVENINNSKREICYSREMLDLINSIYHKDFELFGYVMK